MTGKRRPTRRNRGDSGTRRAPRRIFAASRNPSSIGCAGRRRSAQLVRFDPGEVLALLTASSTSERMLANGRGGPRPQGSGHQLWNYELSDTQDVLNTALFQALLSASQGRKVPSLRVSLAICNSERELAVTIVKKFRGVSVMRICKASTVRILIATAAAVALVLIGGTAPAQALTSSTRCGFATMLSVRG
jgi:hypothetical protein